jgi:hypothetical protein
MDTIKKVRYSGFSVSISQVPVYNQLNVMSGRTSKLGQLYY